MSDVVALKCKKLLCDVIQFAASDAKHLTSARRFFEDHRSPFWEYCEQLDLNGDLIAREVLSEPVVGRKRA